MLPSGLYLPVRSGRRRTSSAAVESGRRNLPYGEWVYCGRLPAEPECRMMRIRSSTGIRAGRGVPAGRASSDGRTERRIRYAPLHHPKASGQSIPIGVRCTNPQHGPPPFSDRIVAAPCSHTKAVRSASRRSICLYGSSKRISVTEVKVANISESAKIPRAPAVRNFPPDA